MNQPQPDRDMDSAAETPADGAPAEPSFASAWATAAADITPAELDTLKKRAAERDEYLDMLQRVRADFANYQKRSQKQQEQDRQYATQAIIRDLLPVIDNLDRAVAASSNNGTLPALLEGVRLVQQGLLVALGRQGVSVIEADRTAFDPSLHEAIATQPSPEVEPGNVVMTLEKGYRLHERVIRPAKVIVCAAPAAGSA